MLEFWTRFWDAGFIVALSIVVSLAVYVVAVWRGWLADRRARGLRMSEDWLHSTKSIR